MTSGRADAAEVTPLEPTGLQDIKRGLGRAAYWLRHNKGNVVLGVLAGWAISGVPYAIDYYGNITGAPGWVNTTGINPANLDSIEAIPAIPAAAEAGFTHIVASWLEKQLDDRQEGATNGG